MSPPGLAELCAAVGVAPDRRGELHLPCPNCGKEPKPGQTHFHVTEKGGHCFVCGWSASHAGLLRRLSGDIPIHGPIPSLSLSISLSKRDRQSPRPWQREPEWWVDFFACAPDSVPLWQAYRPLTPATIARWRLGAGPLPSSRCPHRRLVVPIRRGGRVVALAGRAFCCPPSCDAAKWTLAGGSEFALFGLDEVAEGDPVVVCENRADAALAMQEWPGWAALAKGSANVWRPEWTERLLAVRPARVLFWPDNDEAGYAGAARGANELLAAGLRASVARWSPGYPPKYDLGSLLCLLKREG